MQKWHFECVHKYQLESRRDPRDRERYIDRQKDEQIDEQTDRMTD